MSEGEKVSSVVPGKNGKILRAGGASGQIVKQTIIAKKKNA